LAGTAWVLIRYGNLWEDVRTILLLVVLMLLAISISFDDTLAANSQLGIPLFLCGLVLAIVLSELLLRGIHLRLPIGFRLPYHLTLALFFLYPVVLSQWIRDPENPALYWGLFGFATAAGGVFLSLFPAIRRGADYVAANGSPWKWPWYPWTLFGVMGLGICLRAYYLCISFHFVGSSDSTFGFFFLVPFLWVVNFLLLEAGIVARQRRILQLALLLPVGLVALAVTASPSQASDLGFLSMFHDTLGMSPLFLSVSLVALFYCVALLRRVPEAWIVFPLALAAMAVCGPDTFNLATHASVRGLPILAAGAVYLAVGIRSRNAIAFLLGGWAVVIAAWIDFYETPFAAYQGVVPAHLLLAMVLVVGAVFHDALGRRVQNLGAAAILLLALAAATCPPSFFNNPPHTWLALYPLFAAGGAVAYGFLVKNRWYYACALGSVCVWLAGTGWNTYRQVRHAIVGLGYIVWGVVFFLVAMIVSLSKMGVPQRVYERWRKKS